MYQNITNQSNLSKRELRANWRGTHCDYVSRAMVGLVDTVTKVLYPMNLDEMCTLIIDPLAQTS